ncbi:MAG: hypothetical protein O2894_01645 [Planctomycetota bacterium]|nr:hypothetical protein [Planctomycetota bacterium]
MRGIQRWLGLAVCTAALGAAGCSAGPVMYVDERGNELAVDDQGRPIIPTRSRLAVQPAPSAPSASRATATAPRVRAQPERRVASQATWETQDRVPAPVDSSATLDLPPTRGAASAGLTPLDLPPSNPAPARASSSALSPVDAPSAGAAVPPKVESSSKLDTPPAG